MQSGIFAKTFAHSNSTLEETLDAVVEHGLHCVQFNLAVAGLPTMPDQIDQNWLIEFAVQREWSAGLWLLYRVATRCALCRSADSPRTEGRSSRSVSRVFTPQAQFCA